MSVQKRLESAEKNQMLEMNALQAHLVSILLNQTKGQSELPRTAVEIEGVCKRIFFSSRRSCAYHPIPVVLDVLLILYKENPNFAGELMSCVVLLCLCSIHAWYRAVESGLFELFPHSANILAKVAITKNSCWSHWSQEDLEICATTCVDLSDVDKYVEAGYLLRTTPVSVSVQVFTAQLRPSHPVDTSIMESDVRTFVNRIPSKILSTIRNCDFSFLLQAPEDEHPQTRCLSRVAISDEVRVLTGRKSKRAREEHEKFEIKDMDTEPDLFPMKKDMFVGHYSNMTEGSGCCKNSPSERKAYELAKMSTDKTTADALLTAAGEWAKEGRSNLVNAAFIAAPNLLKHLAGRMDSHLSDIQHFPLSYISPVDQGIDRALREILCCIPEVRTVFCFRYTKGGDGCNELRKAALMYPSLTLRRTMCLCAAGQTLLAGLSEPSDRFMSESLLALQALLSALAALPGSPKPEVEDFCIAVLDFVLEEKRLDNGVPDCLTSLLVSTSSLLCRCNLRREVGTVMDRLNSIVQANCLDKTAAENVERLRSYLLRRQ